MFVGVVVRFVFLFVYCINSGTIFCNQNQKIYHQQIIFHIFQRNCEGVNFGSDY